MTPPSRRKRRVGLAASLVAALILVGAATVVVVVSDPRGSEPSAVVSIPPLASAPGRDRIQAALPSPEIVPTDRTPTASIAQGGSRHLPDRTADEATMEHGVKVFRAVPSASPAPPPGGVDPHGPLIIDVSRALDSPFRPTKAASPSSGETIAAPVANQAKPKLAIFVSSMGLNESVTRTANEIMPSAVTLAFLPIDAGIAASVAAAKARGHEILLQLPMRNNASDRMPHMLEPAEAPAALSDDLKWLMDRFEGYTGIVNLLGAPVTADQTVMDAIMRAVRDRHLFYLDDGTSRKSVAASVAASSGVAAIKADMVLDATADATIVKANLDALAAIARRKGSAIGMASGLPEHLAAIADFARGLEAQGITLVPVGALASSPTSAASAR